MPFLISLIIVVGLGVAVQSFLPVALWYPAGILAAGLAWWVEAEAKYYLHK